MAKHGVVELWLRHDLLTGVAPTLFPFPVGANGIAFFHKSLYVVNTDKAQIVRVPVLPDGSPGLPEVWGQVVDLPDQSFTKAPIFP